MSDSKKGDELVSKYLSIVLGIVSAIFFYAITAILILGSYPENGLSTEYIYDNLFVIGFRETWPLVVALGGIGGLAGRLISFKLPANSDNKRIRNIVIGSFIGGIPGGILSIFPYLGLALLYTWAEHG